MTRYVVAFKRRTGMSVATFQDRWATVGERLVRDLPGLRRYVRSAPHPSAYSRGREPRFDAVEEFSIDSGAPFDRAGPAPGQATLVDPASRVCLPVVEVPVVDAPPAPVKLVMFVRRRPDLTGAQFRAHWRDVHAPIGARNPYLRRYVQWHVRDPDDGTSAAGHAGPGCAGVGHAGLGYDGVGMVWFDSLADVRASGTTPDAAEVAADGPRFAEGGAPMVTLVTAETVVLP